MLEVVEVPDTRLCQRSLPGPTSLEGLRQAGTNETASIISSLGQ